MELLHKKRLSNRKSVTLQDIKKDFSKNKYLYGMITPTILFFIIFSYLPLVGIYYAFTRYNFVGGLFGSPFVGLNNFKFLFKSGKLALITKNTVLYNISFILIGNALQIMIAILLNEIRSKWYKRITQSFLFLPYFISFVLLGAFMYNIFNTDYGFFNRMLVAYGFEPYNIYVNPHVWKYIIVIFYLWKTVGYGSIIYLATIVGISNQIYEAAAIDGANKLQQICKITLPLLKPTFITLVLFSIGSILRGQFELFYQLTGGSNGLLFNATDIIDTFVYRTLTKNFDVGMATAAGLYQSIFGFFMIMTVNALVKRKNKEYALF